MKQLVALAAASALILALALPNALAADADRYIKELKHEDPKVRAKAAYELGCG